MVLHMCSGHRISKANTQSWPAREVATHSGCRSWFLGCPRVPAGAWRGAVCPIPPAGGDGSPISFQVGWLPWLMAC